MELSATYLPGNCCCVELTSSEFEKICQMIYRLCGITLTPGKEGLVKSRLTRRLHSLNLGSFMEYLAFVKNDRSGHELTAMIDLLTTNRTSFFRESEHFEFLRIHILPAALSSGQPIRIWNAGCSSGEEPYTVAMVLRETVPSVDLKDIKILATDISTQILSRAKKGEYAREALQGIPDALIRKYFSFVPKTDGQICRVKDSLKSLVRFARLNLMQNWPMRGQFEVIFCRNVMIYFDKPTRRRLVSRFHEFLKPGGHLFVGHSESLTHTSSDFVYVQPAVYRK
jgi:chemotaxis protein methyltransferase CheR